jgi:hypothetical protein
MMLSCRFCGSFPEFAVERLNSMNRVEKIRSEVYRAGLGLAVLALGAVFQASAQSADSTPGPSMRAARLSGVDGQTQLLQGNQVIADQALANTPLFEGTQVATLEDGRAEIQFDDGSLARISPQSALTLGVMRGQGSAAETEISLQDGLAYFELQSGSSGNIRIRFGDGTVTANGFTILRINLDTPPGEVAVFAGDAHIERGSAMTVDLHGGESLTLDGADPGRYNLVESIEPDSWDAWNADRDQALNAEAGVRTGATNGFADGGNPAWGDLDANGAWYSVPGQGNIWSPYDASNPGWDPYGNGYWMWTPRFGYIWVSGEPWGYLPFQCGAWNYYSGFGWGWGLGVGGCQPWWGGAGWVINIVFAPGGYRPPLRPHPRPVSPHLSPAGGGRLGPYAVVAVNRRSAIESGELPVRDRNVPVTIAGASVQPLRPLARRAQYDRAPVSGAINSESATRMRYDRSSAIASASRPQYGYPGAKPSGGATPSGANRPTGSANGGSRSGSSSAARSSGVGRPAYPSGGSASHASGGSRR